MVKWLRQTTNEYPPLPSPCPLGLLQALGRCIRHVFDYGVICLIDERFQRGTPPKFLAKWMRGLLGEFTGLPHMGHRMKEVRIY